MFCIDGPSGTLAWRPRHPSRACPPHPGDWPICERSEWFKSHYANVTFLVHWGSVKKREIRYATGCFRTEQAGGSAAGCHAGPRDACMAPMDLQGGSTSFAFLPSACRLQQQLIQACAFSASVQDIVFPPENVGSGTAELEDAVPWYVGWQLVPALPAAGLLPKLLPALIFRKPEAAGGYRASLCRLPAFQVPWQPAAEAQHHPYFCWRHLLVRLPVLFVSLGS